MFQTLDILSEDVAHDDGLKYDLLLDKGTYDAISLMEGFGPDVRQRYLTGTANLLKDNGLFVIATCNWTDEEITQQLSSRNEINLNRVQQGRLIIWFWGLFADYTRVDMLPTPVLQFGGKQGHNVSVVIFSKKQ